ncbi:hypothetical protein [Salinispora vitiensis]|uniref:hypothetical protein n=1 Tax=Salinispora vitiensis TaxID=999544 RepID=UPI0003753F0F|nr:hypothetical protein [Salinispora vitiensis]
MLKTRLFRVLLIPTAVLALTACGGGDDSEPAASESNSPSAASSSAPAAAAAKSDEEVCAAFKENQEQFQETFMATMTESLTATEEEMEDAIGKLMTEMATGVTEIAATGNADSEVTAALEALSMEAEKTAANLDSADDVAFEAAGEAAVAACQKVGVEINF